MNPQQPNPNPTPNLPQNPYARGRSFTRPSANPSPMMQEQPIAPTPESKPKISRWIIVVGIVLAILIIVAIIVLLIPSNTQTQGNKNDALKKLYLYGNYIISGENGEEPISGEFIPNNYYALDQAIDAEDAERSDYFAAAIQLFNDFYASAKVGTILSERGLQELEIHKLNLNRLSIYSALSEVTSTQVAESYLKYGEQETVQNLSAQFSDALNSGDEELVAYAEGYVDFINAYISATKQYIRDGCVANNALVLECVYNTPLDDNVRSQTVGSRAQISEAKASLGTKREKILDGIWYFAEDINRSES